LLETLRRSGIAGEIDYDSKSLKAQMRKAEKLGARFVVILGDEEFKNNKVVLRNMKNRSQEEVSLSEIAAKLKQISLH